ncbi:MAG: amidase family protein [Mobilicoccus sp.]|nr:amidase family protein [Mobilicoccus sp.]
MSLPLPHTYMPAEYALLVAEATAFHQQRLREQGEEFEPDVRLLLEVGELLNATDHIKGLRVRTLIQEGWRDLFEQGLDAVLAPTVPNVAAAVGQTEFTHGEPEAIIDSYVRTSAPGNLTGLPALSVPCAFADGLPIGLQIIGRPFAEATVLRIGAAWESLYDHAGALPQL